MRIQITLDQKDFVRREILAAVDQAEDSLANGHGRIITQQSMRDLVRQIKQRGRERLKRK